MYIHIQEEEQTWQRGVPRANMGTRCIGLMSKHGGKIYLPQERTWQHKMSLPLSKYGGNVYFEQT